MRIRVDDIEFSKFEVLNSKFGASLKADASMTFKIKNVKIKEIFLSLQLSNWAYKAS